MIYLKIHVTPEGEIIAMCDEELLGKVYREGKAELDLATYSGFYKGDLVAEKAAESIAAINDFYTANIVGKRAVGIFLKKGLATKDDVRTVDGVHYVQLFKLY
jgi:hypothetical protein